jgi:hypothetical protein
MKFVVAGRLAMWLMLLEWRGDRVARVLNWGVLRVALDGVYWVAMRLARF